MKKLLVLGGMQISCEIVKLAQDMGLYVGVTDYNEKSRSPGKLIADAYHNVSCTDVDAVERLVNEYEYDGIITGFNDMLLPYYAEICDRTGRACYGTKEQFELFTNKKAYKKVFREYGIPVVADYTHEVDSEKMEEIKFPVVVKPSDSSGSRGVMICKNEDEFKQAFQHALERSKQGEVIVERYMDGKEATVFWLFVNGEYYFCGIGNRHCNAFQEGCIFLPVGYTFPSILTDKYIHDVSSNAKRMFKNIGIKNGMMFMQCKVEEGTCYVYDVGYRLTGSLEYKLFEKCCGYNPLKIMIDYAVGDMIESNPKVNPYFNGRFPYNVSILARPGKICSITGLYEVSKMDSVEDIVIEHNAGDEITDSMRGLLSQISVRVLGVAERRSQVVPIMNEIEDKIKIISSKGENLAFGRMNDEDINMVII